LLGRDEPGVDGPVHEGGAGVAGPEGSVAVEYGDAGVEGVDAGVKFWRGEALGGSAVGQEGAPGGVPLRKRIAVNVGGLLGVFDDDGLGAETDDAQDDQQACAKSYEEVMPHCVFRGESLGEHEGDQGQGGHDAVEPDGLNEGVGWVFRADEVGHGGMLAKV
jgi:hypothetical protein